MRNFAFGVHAHALGRLRASASSTAIRTATPISTCSRIGVEIDSIVADGAQSLIREQVEMGVAVRMAVLEALARNLPNA